MSTSAEQDAYKPPAQLPPHAIMWQLLKPVNADVYALEMYFRIASEQITLVDKAPRHDTVLDEKDFELHFIFRTSMDVTDAVGVAIWALKLSTDALNQAAGKMKGCLRGVEKVNLADRLQRHVDESQTLLDAFKSHTRDSDRPKRAFEIRQRCMASLYRRVNALHEMVSGVRTECKQYEFGDDSYSLLLEQETQLMRIRAKVGKWRDNPSQKLGVKVIDAYAQVSAIHRAFDDLKDSLEASCRRQGLRFYNRQGPC